MKILYVSFILIALSFANVFSQDSLKDISYLEKNTDIWKYKLTLGTWMNAVRGDVSADQLYGYIDNRFYNKYNGADFSFYGNFEARKDRVTYSGQFYSSYQSDKFKYDKDTLYSRSVTTVRPFFLSADVSYEFYRNKEVTFDLYGGIRMNILTTLIENFYKTSGSVQKGQTKFFIDPLIGSKFHYIPFKGKNISRLFVKGNFDVGGFGLVSFLSFQSYLGAGYNLNKTITLNLGYRYLDVHYGTDTYLIDAGLQGFEATATAVF
ncbi:MAG: hypothetical protein JSS91_12265 [Bacteroidetes bacterium]|nr:hypothetical protein [Bacteroidota bacterium]